MLNPGKLNEPGIPPPPHTQICAFFFCQISLIPLWDEVPTALKIAEWFGKPHPVMYSYVCVQGDLGTDSC